jgi:voltage-gated potassium channel
MRPQVQERLDRLRLRGAVLMIVTTAVILAVVAAVLERLIDPEFQTMGEALWFTVTTVTTVGYGDLIPESTGGKLVASGLMLLGLGLIPILTSVVVSILIGQRSRAEREAEEREFKRLVELLESMDERLAHLESRRGGQ